MQKNSTCPACGNGNLILVGGVRECTNCDYSPDTVTAPRQLVYIPCNQCFATGVTEIVKGTPVTCPQCNGTGRMATYL